jgi:hypothetical protein
MSWDNILGAVRKYGEAGADQIDRGWDQRFQMAQDKYGPSTMPWDARVGFNSPQQEFDQYTGLGSGASGGLGNLAIPWVAGGTRVIKQAGPRGVGYVEAFNDATGKVMGKLGFKFQEGRGPRWNDIVVNPEGRGQGYAKEMEDALASHFGPEAMREAGFSGNITNSPEYWAKTRDRWESVSPNLSKGIDYALSEYFPQFVKGIK